MEQTLQEHFKESRWVTPKGGFFFWLEMPEGTDTNALLTPALDSGVAFMPGASFFVGSGVDPTHAARTIRLAYSREAEAEIAKGLNTLAELSGNRRAEMSSVG